MNSTYFQAFDFIPPPILDLLRARAEEARQPGRVLDRDGRSLVDPRIRHVHSISVPEPMVPDPDPEATPPEDHPADKALWQVLRALEPIIDRTFPLAYSGWSLVQYMAYRGEEGHFTAMHTDEEMFPPPPRARKIAVTIHLNGPEEYEGGEFRFQNGQRPVAKKGAITGFPVFLPHEITPVTKGLRLVALAWRHGPAWQ